MLKFQVFNTYQEHASYEDHQAVTITRRLRIARVDLVLHLLEGQAL